MRLGMRRFLESPRIERTRGAPYHPMTQGKIERHHHSMKNLVQLQSHAYAWDLESEITRFVDYPGLCSGHATTANGTTNRLTMSRQRASSLGEPTRFNRDARRSNAECWKVDPFGTRRCLRQRHAPQGDEVCLKSEP
jgi:hypothetical protein